MEVMTRGALRGTRESIELRAAFDTECDTAGHIKNNAMPCGSQPHAPHPKPWTDCSSGTYSGSGQTHNGARSGGGGELRGIRWTNEQPIRKVRLKVVHITSSEIPFRIVNYTLKENEYFCTKHDGSKIPGYFAIFSFLARSSIKRENGGFDTKLNLR